MSQHQPSVSPEPSTPILGDVFGPEFRHVHDRSQSRARSSRAPPFSLRASDAHLPDSALRTIQEEINNPGTLLPSIASPIRPAVQSSFRTFSELPPSPVVRTDAGWFVPNPEVDTERYSETREDPNDNDHVVRTQYIVQHSRAGSNPLSGSNPPSHHSSRSSTRRPLPIPPSGGGPPSRPPSGPPTSPGNSPRGGGGGFPGGGFPGGGGGPPGGFPGGGGGGPPGGGPPFPPNPFIMPVGNPGPDPTSLAMINVLNQIATNLSAVQSPSDTKMKQPDPFDGSDPYKLRKFLVNVQLNINAKPKAYDTDSKKISYVLSYLSGSALDWFEPEILYGN